MELFRQGNFKLHSGQRSWFKIDCDALADDDWKVLARLVAARMDFSEVIGVPRGGLRFAEALKCYCKSLPQLPTLIVDDVLTTGRGMEKLRSQQANHCIGVVLFARGHCPLWIVPIFSMFGQWGKAEIRETND